MRTPLQRLRVRRLVAALSLCVASLLLAASPQAGRQYQAAVPTLLMARLRLYSKAPVLYYGCWTVRHRT